MAGKQNLVDSEDDVFGRNITERDNKAKPRQTAPPLSRSGFGEQDYQSWRFKYALLSKFGLL